MIHIVLHEPEIPQNTGNIARTCVATGCSLHLIHPLGFSLDEKQVKRAGLDYWKSVNLTEYKSLDDFLESVDPLKVFPVSTKARKVYSDMDYPEEVYFLFGKESAGLPEEHIKDMGDRAVRLPMAEGQRSLNLSNCAAVMVFEALRQRSFSGLKIRGDLHHLDWE